MNDPTQQWDPGDRSPYNQNPQGQQQYPVIHLYRSYVRYPPGLSHESAPVQPGDVNFSQARIVDTSAEEDGSHSIYNPVMQSLQVPRLVEPFPIQATRSNSCSSSSSSDVENEFNMDVRGETNNEQPDPKQSNSGFSETGMNLRPRGQLRDWVQSSPADIGDTYVEGSGTAAVSIAPDASVHEGLSKLYGIQGYEEKRIKCYTTFTNNRVTPRVASRYADRLCYMPADGKVKCAGCQRTVDLGVPLVHKRSCPVERTCKTERMQGSPSEAVADTRRKLHEMGYTDATIEAVIQKFGEETLQSVDKFLDKLNAPENRQLSQNFQTAPPHELPGKQTTLYETAHAENPSYPVRYPKYEHTAFRLRSFDGRESAFLNIQPERLAEAGFFYNGCDKYKDMVRCFSCDGAVMSWAPYDDPWKEHARIYPNCRFVLYKKGGKFVDSFRF